MRMDANANMISLLDPRGVEVLKRKLVAGEISRETFKAVLKRQMLKRYYERRTFGFSRIMKGLARQMARNLQSNQNNGNGGEAQPTLDMDELFGMVRSRRF
ncbi:MAG: hypothetical protein HZA02_02730 [Nitrospinae bacterium]|nr:hypothetical protein [Nitrospinota bacterium]